MLNVGILTISDMGARGEREDSSGHTIEAMITDAGFRVGIRKVGSDDHGSIVEILRLWSDQVNLILT